MIKRSLALFLAVVLGLSLTGCANRSSVSDIVSEIALPEPSAEAQNMIFGERIAAKPEVVTLYYVSGDGTSFSTTNRTLIISPDESLCEETIDALLFSTASPDRMSFLPPEMEILDVDFSCGIATVTLSLDAHNIQSEQEYLILLATLSNTLLSIDGVRGVNLMIAGHCTAIASLPVGTLTRPLEGITPTYAQYSAERDYFLESETGTITRTATLYFPTSVGEWFVPELREITFDSRDYASALIRALRAGPSESSCAITAIPESTDLLVDNPVIAVNASGERVIELNFSGALRNYLAFSGIDEWELVGSVALTLSSFVPELDAVRICIDSIPITHCIIGEREYKFEDGLIRRSDFDAFIGSIVTLHIPQSDGSLESVQRATSMVRAQSPLSLLCALFDDILMLDNSIEVFPVDVYAEDILGIALEDGVASVNLSANFYRRCQSLSEETERSLVYAIVNTLCELDDVTGVRFYIEGYSAETLAGSIYLKGILMPNPGMVRRESAYEVEFIPSP